MTQLSVCMIVKDEEALLSRCLESVKGIADEIIIVDTGSTDRTKQIAENFGAKIYDYVWSNDFAAARNESLRHAVGKWILVLDADEYLGSNDHSKWIEFLQKEKPEAHLAYTLPVINFTGEKDYQEEMTTAPVTRLFPNFKGIHFERPIHEQLTRGGKEKLLHKKISLEIYHTGYQLQRVTEKSKHERNMSIFNEMKKANKLSAYDWFTLGNQYRFGKEEEEALQCYERAAKGATAKEAWYSHCLMGLISLYFKNGRLDSSWRWTEKELYKYKNFSEYHTIKGIHFETLGFFDDAIASYLEAINTAEQRAKRNQDIWLVDPMYSFETPVQQLVDIYFRLNDNQQAIYWLSKLLNKNNRNPKVLLKLAEWLCQNEEPAAIIGFLDKIYDVRNEAECNLLFKISLVLGQAELVNYYEKYLTTLDNINILDQFRYVILTDKKEEWMSLPIPEVNNDVDWKLQIWVQMVVGALKWNSPQRLREITRILDHDDITQLTSIVEKLFFENSSVEEGLLKHYSSSLFLVSKQLFLIKEFEKFDQFIQLCKSPGIINQLANYFYTLNLTDMAMNYYSILLSQKELDFNSLVNLGLFHANQGYYSDAVEFLDEAIDKQPKAKHLYYSLIQYATREQKQYFIDKFNLQFPDYGGISFVHNFLNNAKKA